MSTWPVRGLYRIFFYHSTTNLRFLFMRHKQDYPAQVAYVSLVSRRTDSYRVLNWVLHFRPVGKRFCPDLRRKNGTEERDRCLESEKQALRPFEEEVASDSVHFLILLYYLTSIASFNWLRTFPGTGDKRRWLLGLGSRYEVWLWRR